MSDEDPPIVRAAVAADLSVMAKMAGQLVRQHHRWDAQRFVEVEDVEQGYRRFFASELPRAEVLLLVAERAGAVVGYAYGRLEERDWNLLLDAYGALHDVYVDPAARRSGVAARLVREAVAQLAERGAPRVVLHSAWANADAQRLFERLGFRKTMVEMTVECTAPHGSTRA